MSDPSSLPPVDDLLAAAVVVRLPMRTRFRGITARETMIFRGPAGWGEFGPFVEYDDHEASAWLAAGIEAAYQGPPAAVRDAVPVNATVPAVPAAAVADVLARYPGADTAKVKVAEPGQTTADDVARVAAVREHVRHVRVDANGHWDRDQAVAAITAIGDVQYVEQPCARVEDLAYVRRRVRVPIAADESIRKASDPFRVVALAAADVAVLKVAPLGGMRATIGLAERLGIPVVISSALDSAVGIAAGVATAAALPDLHLACGLGTGTLFTHDVAEPLLPERGLLRPRWFDARTAVPVDPAVVADPVRDRWWRERLARCHALLRDSGTTPAAGQ